MMKNKSKRSQLSTDHITYHLTIIQYIGLNLNHTLLIKNSNENRSITRSEQSSKAPYNQVVPYT